MASQTQWTWVWVNSRTWWSTGRPGVLRFMGSQRVRHDWATELNWTEPGIATSTGQYTPVFWPPDEKSWLIWKDTDAGKDWGQEEKGTTEDEMVGWHHQLNGHGFGWTPGVGDGQGGLACCGSWGHKESDMTEQLNWTEQSCTLREVKMISFMCFVSQKSWKN